MRAAYSASKHGIRGITRSAALDWAARGIRINQLQPGVIETPMISKGGKKENEEIAAKIAAKRMGAGREMTVPRALPLTLLVNRFQTGITCRSC
jgi:NAD(P)-dependent dehydrogenase (short-subunit alcohol dehydrogenase family)